MPRAKIPYDELRQFIKDRYPWPAFRSVNIVTDHVYHTPKVVYIRKDGAYFPYGWKIHLVGFHFAGIDENLEAQYDYFRSTIVIEKQDLEKYSMHS